MFGWIKRDSRQQVYVLGEEVGHVVGTDIVLPIFVGEFINQGRAEHTIKCDNFDSGIAARPVNVFLPTRVRGGESLLGGVERHGVAG